MQQILINTGMTDSNGKSANLSITLSDDTIEQIEALDKMKPVKIIMPATGHTLLSHSLNKKIYKELKKVYEDKVDKMVTWVIPEFTHRDRTVSAMFAHYKQVIIGK